MISQTCSRPYKSTSATGTHARHPCQIRAHGLHYQSNKTIKKRGKKKHGFQELPWFQEGEIAQNKKFWSLYSHWSSNKDQSQIHSNRGEAQLSDIELTLLVASYVVFSLWFYLSYLMKEWISSLKQIFLYAIF